MFILASQTNVELPLAPFPTFPSKRAPGVAQKIYLDSRPLTASWKQIFGHHPCF